MYQLRFYFVGVETRLTPSLARAKESGPPEVSPESFIDNARLNRNLVTTWEKMRASKRTHGRNNK